MPPRSAGGRADPLAAWLGVDFARPGTQERSFYPELREFLSELLGYPRDRVKTEHAIGGGSADFVFLDLAGRPWVVGDFKLDDGWLTDPRRAEALWQDKRRYVTGGGYLAVPWVALTPMAVLVRDGRLGALSTFVVGEPMGDEEEAEALAAYLNSALVRWYWAVRFRSGVVERYWAKVYPRHLDELPWPRKPDGRFIRRLAGLYRELEGLGAESAQSPEAFLEEALRGAEASGEVLGLSLAKGLDWSGWPGTVPLETLRVEGTALVGDGLLTSLDLRDGDLAEIFHPRLLLAPHPLSSPSVVSSTSLRRFVKASSFTSARPASKA